MGEGEGGGEGSGLGEGHGISGGYGVGEGSILCPSELLSQHLYTCMTCLGP